MKEKEKRVKLEKYVINILSCKCLYVQFAIYLYTDNWLYALMRAYKTQLYTAIE